MLRRDKINYYLDIAETVLERSTCIRRKFGAIIVKHDEIISTGYVGAPRGRKNCNDLNYCTRDKLGRSVHAEQNAILSAARADMIDATLYLACHDARTDQLDGEVEPCSMCKRLIINAGIKQVIVRQTRDAYKIITVSDWGEQDESLTGSSGY